MQQFFNHANIVVIYAIYAISLNLLLGNAGQLSIAHAAFGAIGGYLAGYLAVAHGWDFIPALLVGVAAAGLVGFLTSLPALYLDVRYLILLTLALSTAIVTVIEAIPALGGSVGLAGVPLPNLLGSELLLPSQYFEMAVVLALFVLLVCWRLAHSPFGRVLRGVRDDEIATRGLGKNVVAYKQAVFGITAAMAGLAGVLLVFYNSTAQPGEFSLEQSMEIIAMIVIGGTANLFGSVVGATLLVALEPFLESVVKIEPTDASLARIAIYGGLILLFLLLRPGGLIPEGAGASVRRLLRRLGLGASGKREGEGASSGREGASVRAGGMPALRTEAQAVAADVPAVSGDPQQRRNGDEGAVVLEAHELRKSFGGIHAADGLSLSLRAGHVTGLIGPNGAGKTTVFNLLTRVIAPDSGSVTLRGEEIAEWTPNRIARHGMARSYQDVRIFPRMSVLENVMLAVPHQFGERFENALLRPIRTRREERRVRQKALEHLAFVGLDGKAELRASELPFGEQKLLALARLVATEAEVLLLDEPASGIDIDWVERMLELIAQLRAMGKAICLVEHNLHVVERIADSVYFMESGRITAEGTMSELMGQQRLAEVYFGGA